MGILSYASYGLDLAAAVMIWKYKIMLLVYVNFFWYVFVVYSNQKPFTLLLEVGSFYMARERLAARRSRAAGARARKVNLVRAHWARETVDDVSSFDQAVFRQRDFVPLDSHIEDGNGILFLASYGPGLTVETLRWKYKKCFWFM